LKLIFPRTSKKVIWEEWREGRGREEGGKREGEREEGREERKKGHPSHPPIHTMIVVFHPHRLLPFLLSSFV